MDIRSWVPWQGKIIGKVVLSRLPIGYRLWQKVGVFQHGKMAEPAYAFNVFTNHLERSRIREHGNSFVGLELGPGDSLFSALIAYAYGASASYLVDAGRFATTDIAPYHAMAAYLKGRGLATPDLSGAKTIEDVLKACRASYLSGGLESLRALPDKSIDFIWSQAVLEHIRRGEFADYCREMARVVRPGGVCSHRVDLKDHLGGSLNNLRFRDAIWESKAMASSGFYTNRIRYSEMLQAFKDAGFRVEVHNVDRWSDLPIDRKKLSLPYRDMPVEELVVKGFDVLLRHA